MIGHRPDAGLRALLLFKDEATPVQPDYTAAAEKQAAATKEIATQQNYANRPAQYSPWGSTTWNTNAGIDPATGQEVTNWTQEEKLRPELEHALQSQVNLQSYRSDLGNQFAGRVEQDMSQPYDWSSLPEAVKGPQVGDYGGQRERIEAGLFGRMAPVHEQQEEGLRTRLSNQGLTQGSEAFERELSQLRDAQAGEKYNAMQTAGTEQQRMFGMDTSATEQQNKLRQQAISEESQQRNMSLNELNALMTGQQVSSPQMPSFQSGSTAQQAPNYSGAAQNQYQGGLDAFNANQAQSQGTMSGIAGMAGTAAMIFM